MATYLPSRSRSTGETGAELARLNPHLRLPTGLISRVTGVERVHVRPEGWQASDLAIAAAKNLLAAHPASPDLLIFAAASQDLVEPATAHIVSAGLGLRTPDDLGVPVMDIKNACNSVLNALQVADALIRVGAYSTVLIVSGEAPNAAVRWHLRDKEQFFRSFPGYSMSDAGAAVLLTAAPSARAGSEPSSVPVPGIVASRFHAMSEHWDVGTLPGGGTRGGHDPDTTYFDMDGAQLQAAFMALGPEPITAFLEDNHLSLDDVDLVAIHQVAVPFLPPILAVLGLSEEKIMITVGEHGNLASVTLPYQLQQAQAQGRVGPGSLVLMIGLAGGISLGLMAVRL